MITRVCVALSLAIFAVASSTPLLAVPRSAPEHPRLYFTSDTLSDIHEKIESDEQTGRWYAQIKKHAERILNQPPSKYEIPDGKRLLSTSRRVLDRVTTLAFVYLYEKDERYRDRAWKELEAAGNFKDWNPSHFLDTAEMTHGFAIGYDWLFHAWNDEQRAFLRDAIVRHGLKPGLDGYTAKRPAWWSRSAYNWNQVCNGGLAIGALAIENEESELAKQILDHAIAGLPRAMVSYAPDGAWAEGPGYWAYATRYNVAVIACLQSAKGDDFGLLEQPGFEQAGDFPMYMTGPTNTTFNFADGGARAPRSPTMFFLADRYDRPDYAVFHLPRVKPTVFDLIWYDPVWADHELKLPRGRYFKGMEVLTMRTSWTDPDAGFLGFKCGQNGVNHGNLDLGSFVYEADGVRWAIDLGADNYNMPGYFRGNRWAYYRLRSEGHNTLVINPSEKPNQAVKAFAKIDVSNWRHGSGRASSDLTTAYAHNAERVVREVRLDNNRIATIKDTIRLKDKGDIYWFMHTKADVSLVQDGRVAELKQDGKTLRAMIASPAEARFSIMDARPLPESPDPSMQSKNKDVRKLVIHLEDQNAVELEVRLAPKG